MPLNRLGNAQGVITTPRPGTLLKAREKDWRGDDLEQAGDEPDLEN
jgi:hypothetical protein